MLNPFDLGKLHLRFYHCDHALGKSILNGEDVAQVTLESVRPDVERRRCIDELSGKPNAIALAPHAALKNIADPKLASDLTNIDCLALVGERRVSGDHE